MNNIIQPKTLPGTMELLPREQLLFNEVKNKIEKVYQSFGFLPLDTPIIESSNVLLAKAGGETEKQVYRFLKGDNDICLRFDLTVPLAKYVAANLNDLTFPFKRYQIGKVYRGEKAQKGRYREFYQCDIDIIGKDKLSIKNDAECPAVIYSVFKELDFGEFVIYINNRKIINGLFEELGLTEKKLELMRLLDKYDKMGREKIILSLREDFLIDEETTNKLLSFIEISGDTNTKLELLKSFPTTNETYLNGVKELEEVIKYIRLQNVPDKNFEIKLTIVRGLDYYTGTVFETVLTDYPQLGSVCGGGRYDNLAGLYTNSILPGVGIAIGLTRLFYQLCENNLIKSKQLSNSKVLVIPMDDTAIDKSYEITSLLRLNGINCQIYTEETKFKNKLAYADKLEIPYVIIIGEDEIKNNTLTLKDMVNRSQTTITADEIISSLK